MVKIISDPRIVTMLPQIKSKVLNACLPVASTCAPANIKNRIVSGLMTVDKNDLVALRIKEFAEFGVR